MYSIIIFIPKIYQTCSRFYTRENTQDDEHFTLLFIQLCRIKKCDCQKQTSATAFTQIFQQQRMCILTKPLLFCKLILFGEITYNKNVLVNYLRSVLNTYLLLNYSHISIIFYWIGAKVEQKHTSHDSRHYDQKLVQKNEESFVLVSNQVKRSHAKILFNNRLYSQQANKWMMLSDRESKTPKKRIYLKSCNR